MSIRVETLLTLPKFVNVERFAYDIITYSMVKFGVPETIICKWEGEENDYSDPEFIRVISRIIFKYQITQRLNWGCIFFVRYFLTDFKSFADISEALHIAFKLSQEDSLGCVLYEVMLSLAVVCELTLFLFTNNLCIPIKRLVSTWNQYFLPVRERFESAGGLTVLYMRFRESEHVYLDPFYINFIGEFCVPYNSEDLPHLYYHYYDKFNYHFYVIGRNSRPDLMFDYTCQAFLLRSRTMMRTKEILKLSLSPELMHTVAFEHREFEMKLLVPIPPQISLVSGRRKRNREKTTEVGKRQIETEPRSSAQASGSDHHASDSMAGPSTSKHNMPHTRSQDIAAISTESSEAETSSSSSNADGMRKTSPSKAKRLKISENTQIGSQSTRNLLQDSIASMPSASSATCGVPDISHTKNLDELSKMPERSDTSDDSDSQMKESGEFATRNVPGTSHTDELSEMSEENEASNDSDVQIVEYKVGGKRYVPVTSYGENLDYVEEQPEVQKQDETSNDSDVQIVEYRVGGKRYVPDTCYGENSDDFEEQPETQEPDETSNDRDVQIGGSEVYATLSLHDISQAENSDDGEEPSEMQERSQTTGDSDSLMEDSDESAAHNVPNTSHSENLDDVEEQPEIQEPDETSNASDVQIIGSEESEMPNIPDTTHPENSDDEEQSEMQEQNETSGDSDSQFVESEESETHNIPDTTHPENSDDEEQSEMQEQNETSGDSDVQFVGSEESSISYVTDTSRKENLVGGLAQPQIQEQHQMIPNTSDSLFEEPEESTQMPSYIEREIEDPNRLFKRWLLYYWYEDKPLVLKLLDPPDAGQSEFERNRDFQQNLDAIKGSSTAEIKSHIEHKGFQQISERNLAYLSRTPEIVQEPRPGPSSEPQYDCVESFKRRDKAPEVSLKMAEQSVQEPRPGPSSEPQYGCAESFKSRDQAPEVSLNMAEQIVQEPRPGPSSEPQYGCAEVDSTEEEELEELFLEDCEDFMEHLLRYYLFCDIQVPDEVSLYNELCRRTGLKPLSKLQKRPVPRNVRKKKKSAKFLRF